MKKKTIAGLAALGAVLGVAAVAGIITTKKKNLLKLSGNSRKEIMPKRNVYFAGGGLSALAGAYHLIYDCNIPADSIHIFGEPLICGGLFANSGKGFAYAPSVKSAKNPNLMDILKGIPSLNIPELSVKEEIIGSYANNSNNVRLISADGLPVPERFTLSRSAIRLIKTLLSAADCNISDVSVEEYFITASDFFDSNLWSVISTAYLMPRSASVLNLKRILSYAAGDPDALFRLSDISSDAEQIAVAALKNHLISLGVEINPNCIVKDIDFYAGTDRISAIHLMDNATAKTFYFNTNDLCFITNGSLYEGASQGDYNESVSPSGACGASAVLWNNIAQKCDRAGNPTLFCNSDNSAIVSFAITTKASRLTERIAEATNSAVNSAVLTTFKESPWGLTISDIFLKEDTYIICGYGTEVSEDGKFIDKALKEASGAEILFELVKLLRLENEWEEIIDGIIDVIPCLMPFAAAPILPHSVDALPQLSKNTNFAFIGQYASLDNGIPLTAEYCVKSAREAVYKLTRTNKSSVSYPKMGILSHKKLISALKK